MYPKKTCLLLKKIHRRNSHTVQTDNVNNDAIFMFEWSFQIKWKQKYL